MNLHPFIRYYGGKWRSAPRYPAPRYNTIIEPFAGAAGYSLRYHERRIVLVEKHPVIAEMWRYLIGVSSEEIRRIPYVEHVGDLPAWVPEGGRTLVGFAMNAASVLPCKSLSAGLRQHAARGWKHSGWTEAQRERVALQVDHIRHWQIVEGDYTLAPNDREATHFIDPPYNNAAGARYPCGPASIDYSHLAAYCRSRRGQVIACENEGATWLPFRSFGAIKAGPAKRVSHEVIWTNDAPIAPDPATAVLF